MKLSIRNRLTLTITLVFFCSLGFLMAAGVLALYLGLTAELDKALRRERAYLRELMQTQFAPLTQNHHEITPEILDLRDELAEDLNEIVGFKHEFIIIGLTSGAQRRMFSDARQKNILLQLPEGFLSRDDGYYNLLLNQTRYRVNISQNAWGTLVIGIENRTFYEVMNEFKDFAVLGLPLAILTALVGGWLLAKIVMRPVVTIAREAESISLSNLQARLPVYTAKDEFGILIHTLNKMIARLEEGVKQIRQFTQDAAHELRTPLTIQRGELELLYQREDLPEEIRPILQRTLDRVISMSQLVDNLMLLAQSDSGRYPVQKQRIHLDRMLREIVEDCQILAENRRVEISLSRCDQSEYEGDPQLLRRLLFNLTDNALKYTQNGRIDFSLENRNGQIHITITDTGIGIPEEELPHIFDRFYRVDKARTAQSGSGLGLAICRWIVTAHGGEIVARNRPGGGTAFEIRLKNNRQHPDNPLS